MISRAAQTNVSIPQSELSAGDEFAAVGGAAIAKHLRQPRGKDCVPYLASVHEYEGMLVDLGSTSKSTNTLMFPSMQMQPQDGQMQPIREQSPFRVSNVSGDIVGTNTPLRDGPGPLHLHSPGLSPIVHRVLDKENVVEEGGRKSHSKDDGGQISEGIAYRPALKELNHIPRNEQTLDGVSKQSGEVRKINESHHGGEEESKLLSMDVLNDTTLTNVNETRALSLPTHHQLHNYREQRDSSLEIISLLVDQSSVQTPQREQKKASRAADDTLGFISPLKASAQKAPAQHTDSSKNAVQQQYRQPVAFGIEVDRTGSPVVVPLKMPPVSMYGHASGTPFASASAPFAAPVSSSWAKPGMMSSNFWKERMSRRSMSSVLSSPAGIACL